MLAKKSKAPALIVIGGVFVLAVVLGTRLNRAEEARKKAEEARKNGAVVSTAAAEPLPEYLPIEVTITSPDSVEIETNDYIKVTVKNLSQKSITGLQIEFSGLKNFGVIDVVRSLITMDRENISYTTAGGTLVVSLKEPIAPGTSLASSLAMTVIVNALKLGRETLKIKVESPVKGVRLGSATAPTETIVIARAISVGPR